MSNLKDFYKSKKAGNENISEKYKEYAKAKPEEANDLNEKINKYKSLSQGDLMSELLREASRLKENGQLNSQSIDLLKNTLTPFLTPEQKSSLDNIIDQIK